MRPSWSADPLDTLVTATAPLCNQGIHGYFYPASAFFLTNRGPPGGPGGRPGRSAGGLLRKPIALVGIAGGHSGVCYLARKEGRVIRPPPL